MFLKAKITLTIVALYEILVVILLQSQRVCDAMFGVPFCDANVFKYFIMCFAVPMIVFLIVMWIMDIIEHVRRRHTLFYKATHAMKNIAENVFTTTIIDSFYFTNLVIIKICLNKIDIFTKCR